MSVENIQVVPVMPTFLQETGLSVFTAMTSPEFSIQGDDSQVLTIAVAPNQQVQAEPGAMCFASNDMKQKTKLGGLMRMVAGEPIFKSTWINEGSEAGFVALTNAIPSTIIPLNLDALGGSVLCARDAFLASIQPDVKISVGLIPTASCLACCCSGLTPILQKIDGSGWVFLAAHGTIMQKILGPGEEIVVDTNSVVGVATSVSVDVVQTGGCSAMCCSGEGLFNTTLKGPGIVLINSLPLPKLRRLFTQRQGSDASGGGNGGGN